MDENPCAQCAYKKDTMNEDRIVLSWSRLADYETCGQRVLRIREGKAAPKDGRIFLPGTVADRAVREYLTLDDPQPGHLIDSVDRLLEHYITEDPEYVIRWMGDHASDRERVRQKVMKVLTELEPILWEKVIPYGYQPDARFRITLGVPYLDGRIVPIELIGAMDILTMTLDGSENYAVYDLKATENDNYVRGKTLAQLIFYAIAIKSQFGKYPVETAFLTPACKEKVVPLVVTEKHIREMVSRIIRYCHGVWKEEWAPRDKIDDECRFCVVKHACDIWRLPHGQKMSFDEMASRRKG